MPSVANFLLERLENIGLKHVFSIPGDYILNFFPKLVESKKLKLINNVDEAGAGFAADAYARASGVGCVVATYNVGALKLCNPIAGAYAEKSPVIVISGAPGTNEREFLMHHATDNYQCQQEVFKRITCAQAVLDNPVTAGYEIDRCIEALKYYKQPIYIELPRDIANETIQYDVYTQGTPKPPQSSKQNMEDALNEIRFCLNKAKNPVILVGVEVSRCQLGRELVKFAEKNNIPIVSTLLSKSSINETHPLYVGVYAGANSSYPHVKDIVENSDCLLVCGEVITEATFGYRPSKIFEKWQMITCTINETKVRSHRYEKINFVELCKNIFKLDLEEKKVAPELPKKEIPTFVATENKKLTTLALLQKINSILDSDKAILADAGDSLLGASDMVIANHSSFFGPAYYLSMGFAIPAALGVGLARKGTIPLVIVGDGAFQMSCTELGSMLKWGVKSLIFVLNNGGYTTERMILDGPFNDILNWQYDKINLLLGGGNGFRVETEDQLDSAVNTALKSDKLSIINCIVDPFDASPALKRIASSFSKKVKVN